MNRDFRIPIEVTTNSEAETIDYGCRFGQSLENNDVVCLFGDLGAGKTTFMKGIWSAFEVENSEPISSPTFVYLNIYKEKKPSIILIFIGCVIPMNF